MSKFYKIFILIVTVLFISGCSYTPKEDDNNTEPNGQPVSEANVTINTLFKTNDITPTFSGTYNEHVKLSLGVSIEVGGAFYKVYPTNDGVDDGTWSIDLEVPNVKNTDNLDISVQTGGTLDLTRDGNYTIKVKVEDNASNTFQKSMTFQIDTTTDAVVTLDNIERRSDRKPKFSGTGSNVEGAITINLADTTYLAYVDSNNSWTLDTKITQPTVGSLNLEENKFYTVSINAQDIDENAINEINSSFLPGLLEISGAYYWDTADDNVSNDWMYIFFNRVASSASFLNPHLVYEINGTGSIGTGSTHYYHFWNSFSVDRIDLDENSEIMDINITTISIKPSTIEDSLGFAPSDDNTPQKFKLFNYLALMSSGDDACIRYSVVEKVINVEEVNCTTAGATRTEGYMDINQSQYFDKMYRSLDVVGDKIVEDLQLGLIWEDVNSSTYNYSDAENYCENLNHAGYQDWRIPTMVELQSIVDRNTTHPAVIQNFTQVTHHDGYWSSNSYVDDSKQWGVDFTRGTTFYKDKTQNSYIRCVRRIR